MPNYVAVFGTEEEYQEFNSSPKDHELKNLAEQIVRRLHITTPRKNPVRVKIGVYKLEIASGQLSRRLVHTYEIMPYLERMTQEERPEIFWDLVEYFLQLGIILVREQSWDRGHSSGLEEVISYANELVDGLKPCIEKFKERHKIKKSA